MSGRSVLVALDKERHLRFDINALCDLEQLLGVGLGNLFASPGGIGITTLRAALWAGLKHEDPGLSVAGTGELVQAFVDKGGDFASLGEKIRDALRLAGFGAKDGGEVKSDAAPFDSGSGSTPPSP